MINRDSFVASPEIQQLVAILTTKEDDYEDKRAATRRHQLDRRTRGGSRTDRVLGHLSDRRRRIKSASPMCLE